MSMDKHICPNPQTVHLRQMYFTGCEYAFDCFLIFICLVIRCARPQLHHAASLAMACELLLKACGIQFTHQGWNAGSHTGSSESQPQTTREVPVFDYQGKYCLTSCGAPIYKKKRRKDSMSDIVIEALPTHPVEFPFTQCPLRSHEG